MRQTFKLFTVVAIALIALYSCERDDICAASTPTTPRLIIRFFDAENPSEPKEPQDFAIGEIGSTSFRVYTGDSIAIPLRTDIEVTDYNFVINITNPIDDPDLSPPNDDVVNFAYGITEEFVSKACGFRVTYNTLERQVFPGESGDFWIQSMEIRNQNITDESAAHIYIFH